MRIILAASLTILFLLAPVTRGQTEGFPPCSSSELSWVLSQEADYDALFAILATGDTSPEDVLAYSAAQIDWREALWAQLPPCAEAIDAAVLMSQISSDWGGMGALTYAGVSLSLNRYKDRLYFDGNLRDRLTALLAEIAALIASEERPTEPTPGERKLPACAGEEFLVLHDALRANEDVIALAMEIRSREALLDYINEKLAWRDDAWTELPSCAEAVSIGRLMSQTASDFATALAYRYADVPRAENPVRGSLLIGLDLLGDWLGLMLEEAGVEIEIAAVESAALDLERCSQSAIAELSVRLHGFNDVIEMAFDVQDFGDYLDFSVAHIAWRNQLFSQMPLCAESIASSTQVANLADDFTALFALSFAGIDAEENPYWDEVEASMPVVHEVLQTFPSYAEEAEYKVGFGDRLPACTAAERDAISAAVEDNRYAFTHLANEIETREELLAFSELQRRWRAGALSELPPCQEAMQAGLLLIQLSGDMIPIVALQLFTELPVVQNPYWDEVRVAREAIAAIIDDAEGE